jgi:prevent-host-death family protein
MLTVTSTEFQQNAGRYQDEALSQPIIITHHGRERLVMLSAEEYRRLKRRDREVLKADEISDEDLAALERIRAPESSKAFDDELKAP